MKNKKGVLNKLPKDLVTRDYARKVLKSTPNQIEKYVVADYIKKYHCDHYRGGARFFNRNEIDALAKIFVGDPELKAQLISHKTVDEFTRKPKIYDFKKDSKEWERDLNPILKAKRAIDTGVPLNSKINIVERK